MRIIRMGLQFRPTQWTVAKATIQRPCSVRGTEANGKSDTERNDSSNCQIEALSRLP